ncbi:MAG: ABC transporter permease [Anaerolineae bacterium]
MSLSTRYFKLEQPRQPLSWRDAIVILVIAVLIYIGARLAIAAPGMVAGPAISLSPWALPRYALFSVLRMAGAYGLSLLFSLTYGRLAAANRRAEQVLMPLLDILQSVPILSFLPVVLLSFSALLPQRLAAELASIVLIFTSQAWNLTFVWYQSLATIPEDLREANVIFRFNGWLRFKYLELPFAVIGLIWNSIMSWAGGWFFLMAAETFTVGQHDFRLPGLGSYLQKAANAGDLQAIAWGLAALVLVIVGLDQMLWRPLLAWAERFKLQMVDSDSEASSWFYEAWRNSRLVSWLGLRLWEPLGEQVDAALQRLSPVREHNEDRRASKLTYRLLSALLAFGLAYGAYRAAGMLALVPLVQWGSIAVGLVATLLRVFTALAIALAWTIPVGVMMGTNPTRAALLQPLVQIAASLPATALFPVLLLVLLRLPGGLSLAAVFLMLAGTQWYLLFNVIAGANSIPQDLKYTSSLLQINGWQRWRTLILPALYPYLVTGAITASGGAWNASIVAEHTTFAGQQYATIGIGALISHATASGDYPLLLAATLTLVLAVVLINRLLWRRLYQIAEQKYRLE